MPKKPRPPLARTLLSRHCKRVSAIFSRIAGSDFARSGALVLGATILANVLNYAYYVLIGRALSIADYGAVMSLISAILVIFGVGTIGQTVTAKLVADLRASNEDVALAGLCRTITIRSMWIAAAIALGGLIFQYPIAAYLHLEQPMMVVIAAATAGIGLTLLAQRGIFQGLGAFVFFGLSSIADGTKALMVTAFAHGFGAIGVLWALFAAIALGAIFGQIVMTRRFGGARLVRGTHVQPMLRTAGATALASLGIVVLMFYDVVLARHFLDPTSAGLYGSAALAGRVLYAGLAFLPTILLPSVTLRAASGRSHRHLLGAALGLAVAAICAMGLLCAEAPQVVMKALAGPKFLGAAPLLVMYVAASGSLALANLFCMYSIARHKFGFVPYLLAFAAGEILLVALRHGSSIEIVQDILCGHLVILCTTGLSVASWLFGSEHPQAAGALAN